MNQAILNTGYNQNRGKNIMWGKGSWSICNNRVFDGSCSGSCKNRNNMRLRNSTSGSCRGATNLSISGDRNIIESNSKSERR